MHLAMKVIVPPKLARAKAKAIKHVRGCSRKKRFLDHEEAEIVFKEHPEQRIYHCDYCDGFHLTSSPTTK